MKNISFIMLGSVLTILVMIIFSEDSQKNVTPGTASVVTPAASDSKEIVQDQGGAENAAYAKIIGYGNGIYYFQYNEEYFGKALSAFVEAHKDLEPILMASNNSRGYTYGYFVVFQIKK